MLLGDREGEIERETEMLVSFERERDSCEAPL